MIHNWWARTVEETWAAFTGCEDLIQVEMEPRCLSKIFHFRDECLSLGS